MNRINKLTITCVVDNSVRISSRFWGEHGLSFLIEADERQLLLDTGASGTVLEHNLPEVGAWRGSITALALSHSHYDHTGGLATLLGRHPSLPLYAHPDLLRERFSRRQNEVKSLGLRLTEAELRALADLRLSTAPQEILPGVWTTGEISARPEPEGRSSHHFVRDERGWAPDPYRDDLSLVLLSSVGLVLLCGCCHAGLLNTLAHVQHTFGQDPVAIVGGTHLDNADEAHLQRLIEILRPLGPPALYPNHCTGQAAYLALAQAFAGKVTPCPAGATLQF